MIRDPFYRAIESRLAEGVDAELFERCAADILRVDFPTLAPVRGGGDAGMDGAIAVPGEMPMPLVCTTSTDVIGNLSRSLDSYVEHGGESRRVVSATSQAMTATRRMNLHKKARDKGFTLVNIYDRAAFVDRLYRNPKWCNELLGLDGSPSAISDIPLSSRILSDVQVIGRDSDLAWLRETQGHKLIFGQPGIGKTSIFLAFLEEGNGGFLVSDDQGKTLEAIRAQQPEFVIIDDAHIHPDRLSMLMHLREETGFKFSIIASTWPGQCQRIQTLMGIASSAVHEIDLLTRDEIVQVIRAMGIGGPDELIGSIVDQARGRPGLAATLCRLCLNGGVRDVVLGDALARDVQYTMSPLVSDQDIHIIACFAIGGARGMKTSVVAAELGVAKPILATSIAELAHAGVVIEIGSDADSSYAIVPEVLRFALVRDVFFNNPVRLNPAPLIDAAISLDAVARTLVGAASRGARIPQDQLLEVLHQTRSVEAWTDFSWLGPQQAQVALELHPESSAVLAEPLLEHVPELALPQLIALAEVDRRPPHQHPEHPFRKIEDWIEGAGPGIGDAVQRRKLLLEAVLRWVTKNPGSCAASEFVSLALSPKLHRTSVDPGAGNKISWWSGQIVGAELEELTTLRNPALEAISLLESPNWGAFFKLVAEWSHPYAAVEGRISNETREFMRSFACEFLSELVLLPNAGPGMILRAHRSASRFGCEIHSPSEVDFETLYPTSDDYSELNYERYRRDASALAFDWARQDPTTITERLSYLEREAERAGISTVGMRTTPWLADELAKTVEDPLQWIDALFASDVPSDIVLPFLQRGIAEGVIDTNRLSQLIKKRKQHTNVGIVAALRAPVLSNEMHNFISPLLSGRKWIVESEASRNLIPDETLKHILRHPDVQVASECAFGIWSARIGHDIPSAVKTEWKEAIRRSPEKDYPLGEILATNPDLAYDWLRLQVDSKDFLIVGSREDETFVKAIASLDHGARMRILELLCERDVYHNGFVAKVIGDDIALYRWLLDEPRLSRYHSEPLGGYPSDAWRERVKVAIERGIPPRNIASHIFPLSGSWTGPESLMWKEWVERFEPYISDEDVGVREVARIFLEQTKAQLERARSKERREAVLGRE